MKSTSLLLKEIKENGIDSIEVNHKTIRSSKAIPELNDKYNDIRYAQYVGDNKVMVVAGYQSNTHKELICFDLATKKMTTRPFDLPENSRMGDFVVLDNPNNKYIALGVAFRDDYSKLLILNTETMKIEKYPAENIGSHAAWNSYSATMRLHKYNGQLYGIVDTYGPTIFTAPSIFNSSSFKLQKKVKMHESVHISPGTDIAIDRTGVIFLPYGNYAYLSTLYDNATTNKIMNGGDQLAYNMELLQNVEGNAYLIYWSSHDNDLSILKNYDGHKGIFPTIKNKINFHNERIENVKVLSEESKLILVSTEKTSYVYDLENQVILGNINHQLNYASYVNPILGVDGIMFATHFDFDAGGHSIPRVKLSTVCQMQESNELKTVLDALKQYSKDSKVKELIISDVDMNDAILQDLYDLKKMRPDLKLTLSDNIQSMLDVFKSQEAKEIVSSTKIKAMEDTQQAQQAIIAQLRSSITNLEQKKQKESEQFSKERQALQLQLTEQAAQSSAAMTTMEHKLSEQQKAFSTKEQAFLESEAALKEAYETGIVAVKMEMQATSERYEELFTQLSVSSLPAQSLAKQIYQADQLDERLCQELIDPKHNIKGLSLIRWSEQDELKHVKEDLEQRGVIFHVDDLVKKIKQIEPPYNDKQTLKSFTKAIERLELDYKNNVLPQSEVKSLIALITPDIQNDIDIYPWLQELYFPKTEVLKDQLIQQFFSNEAKAETISAVESEFLRAVDNILKNSKYKHHHARLKDNNLLTLIRANENKFDPLVSLIIKTIDITNINLTTEQEAVALQAVLEEPTEKLNKLVDVKIIQYLEKMKESVDPKLVKIQRLENKNDLLEKQLARVTNVSASMFKRNESNTIAQPLSLRRSRSWS